MRFVEDFWVKEKLFLREFFTYWVTVVRVILKFSGFALVLDSIVFIKIKCDSLSLSNYIFY